MSIIIDSIEYYLPEKTLENSELSELCPEWDMDKVVEKTGVIKRHVAGEDETAYDLSVKACDKIFSKIDKDKIDGIIYCTQSPDYIMPSNSFLLHSYLKLNNDVFVFDFNHACTGYVYGIAMANSFIKSGMAETILLVTADTYTKYINPGDRSTRVLFGDGAAATIVKKSINSRGVIDCLLGSYGSGYDKFWIPAGGMRMPKSDRTSYDNEDIKGLRRSKNDIEMDGLGVWSFINSVIPEQVENLLEKNNYEKDDIDQFIFHQASKMTLDSIVKKLNVNQQRVFVNIENIGNTVSSSIPIALKDALVQGKIKAGSTIVVSGFGVGLAYGSILMKY